LRQARVEATALAAQLQPPSVLASPPAAPGAEQDVTPAASEQTAAEPAPVSEPISTPPLHAAGAAPEAGIAGEAVL